MWRYNPGYRAIVEALHQGWLGDVFLVRGFMSNNLAPARRPEWGDFPGGSMFEQGSHLVDATVRLLGESKSVTPFLCHHGKFEDALKDNNVAVLEYDFIDTIKMIAYRADSSMAGELAEHLARGECARLASWCLQDLREPRTRSGGQDLDGRNPSDGQHTPGCCRCRTLQNSHYDRDYFSIDQPPPH